MRKNGLLSDFFLHNFFLARSRAKTHKTHFCRRDFGQHVCLSLGEMKYAENSPKPFLKNSISKLDYCPLFDFYMDVMTEIMSKSSKCQNKNFISRLKKTSRIIYYYIFSYFSMMESNLIERRKIKM